MKAEYKKVLVSWHGEGNNYSLLKIGYFIELLNIQLKVKHDEIKWGFTVCIFLYIINVNLEHSA